MGKQNRKWFFPSLSEQKSTLNSPISIQLSSDASRVLASHMNCDGNGDYFLGRAIGILVNYFYTLGNSNLKVGGLQNEFSSFFPLL